MLWCMTARGALILFKSLTFLSFHLKGLYVIFHSFDLSLFGFYNVNRTTLQQLHAIKVVIINLALVKDLIFGFYFYSSLQPLIFVTFQYWTHNRYSRNEDNCL